MGKPILMNSGYGPLNIYAGSSEPREVNHLSTWRKINQTEIPIVAASEIGTA
jgi:hypothetical protein